MFQLGETPSVYLCVKSVGEAVIVLLFPCEVLLVYPFPSVFWLFTAPRGHLVYFFCSWCVTAFAVWLGFLTGLHVVDLGISFGSQNLVHRTWCTALGTFPFLCRGTTEADLSHCGSRDAGFVDLFNNNKIQQVKDPGWIPLSASPIQKCLTPFRVFWRQQKSISP